MFPIILLSNKFSASLIFSRSSFEVAVAAARERSRTVSMANNKGYKQQDPDRYEAYAKDHDTKTIASRSTTVLFATRFTKDSPLLARHNNKRKRHLQKVARPEGSKYRPVCDLTF